MSVSGTATLAANNAGGIYDFVLAGRVFEALRERPSMIAFMQLAQFAANSSTCAWKKKAAIAAVSVAEGVAAAPAQKTTTKVTAAGGKVKAVIELTDEAQIWGGTAMDECITDIARALADKVDLVCMALFTGLSGSVGTSGGALLPVDLLDAALLIREQNVLISPIAILAPKAHFYLQQYILTAGASMWANPAVDTLLGNVKTSVPVGKLGPLDIYTSTNVPTSGSDDVGAVFAPDITFGLGVPSTLPGATKFGVQRGQTGLLNGADMAEGSFFLGVGEIEDKGGQRVLSAT